MQEAWGVEKLEGAFQGGTGSRAQQAVWFISWGHMGGEAHTSEDRGGEEGQEGGRVVSPLNRLESKLISALRTEAR